MPRNTQTPADVVLTHATALFATQGIEKTSLADVARAAGLSKAGVLHHFPTMGGLRQAVLDDVNRMVDDVVAPLRAMMPGPERDRAAVTRLVDCVFANPASLAFVFGATIQQPTNVTPEVSALERAAFGAFEDDFDGLEPERLVRVTGAFSTVMVASLRALRAGNAPSWRAHIERACLDVLGHHTP